jgi:flagellar hook-associated protein 1 FlgK
MAGSIIGIAGSGLNAQGGPLVISHNVANASAEGFHRQHAVSGIQTPEETGSGKGATVETLRRAYSEFLDNCVLQAQTQSAYLDACNVQIRQIENLLTAPASGLSPGLQAFFSGVQDVASHPASVASRQQLLSLAQTLVGHFETFSTRLTEMRHALNRQVSDTVAEINSMAENLARINGQIVRTGASENRANDLFERRDLLVAQLNMLVRVSAVRQSDGSVNVFIANGHGLLLGTQAFSLAATPSAEDPQDDRIFHVSSGIRIPLDPAGLRGGRLSGLFAFRSETLDPAQNQLGRVAVVLAQTFNDQHRMGMDLQGDMGQAFFGVPLATVLASQDNTGTAVIAADNSNVGALAGSDYRLQLNAGAWTLTRLTDNTRTIFAGFPQTLDGVTLTLSSGAAANGDSFLIQPTRNGARGIAVLIADTAKIAVAAPVRYDTSGIYDNRNALPLGALQTRGTVANGTANYQGAYDQIVREVGNQARSIEVQGRAQQVLVEQARETQQSLSGVNLDEEAANLIRHQQVYQASGKVLQVAARLFDSLLETSE